jgi:isoprenylcysteine carboxyl methyltransferase (ICMT) family protein YpbQ
MPPIQTLLVILLVLFLLGNGVYVVRQSQPITYTSGNNLLAVIVLVVLLLWVLGILPGRGHL